MDKLNWIELIGSSFGVDYLWLLCLWRRRLYLQKIHLDLLFVDVRFIFGDLAILTRLGISVGFWTFRWSLVVLMEHFVIELDSMKIWGLRFVLLWRWDDEVIWFCFEFWLFQFGMVLSMEDGCSVGILFEIFILFWLLLQLKQQSFSYDWVISYEFLVDG